MSQRIKIALVGASGRTGGLIPGLIKEFPSLELSAAVVSATSPKIGKVCIDGAENSGVVVRFSSSVDEAIKKSDVVIDFSTPEVSLEVAKSSAQHHIPTLIATTGHTEDELRAIRAASASCAILLAPNTSTAVFVTHELSALAKRLLGPSFDIEIMEIHHRNKKDSPSGTAFSLARNLSDDRSQILTKREGSSALRTPSDLTVLGLRGGDVPGEHTVYFLGDGERIEITQRARDRTVFARGALRLAELLANKSPGVYSVRDMYAAP